ncbi:MAG: GNAT family N-acetyltransferase [Legionella sp.]|nr:GNAT family N-acetyltransferase [Legionella sp.]
MHELNFPYKLSSSNEEESEYISNEIMHFNAQKVPFTQKETPIFKRYVIKNDDEIIAGINAVMYHWGILYIDELFVAEAHRHQKLGGYLLRRVEDEARELGASLSHTDTFDFQAKDFYLKQGYDIFGTLENCPPNHCRFFLKKNL